MPILGIIASSASPNVFANSYESIATSAGGAATITFSSIPATYQHLQLRAMVRVTSGTSGTDNLGFRLNSDSGSNYAYHYLSGTGASATASAGTSQTGMLVRDMIPRNSFTANVYGVLIIDILDYKDTNKYKTTRTLSGMDGNGSGTVALNSGLWQSTSAVTSISLYDFDNTGYAFSSDSSFALYGIKG